MPDQLEDLIFTAHDIYDGYTIFEVMDLDDRELAVESMIELFAPPDWEKIERNFGILERVRVWKE
jgi:hypothetical protein